MRGGGERGGPRKELSGRFELKNKKTRGKGRRLGRQGRKRVWAGVGLGSQKEKEKREKGEGILSWAKMGKEIERFPIFF